jgi:hypothetical protein
MVLQQFLRAHERVIANPVMVDNVIHIARNVHDTLKYFWMLFSLSFY